MEKYLVFEKKEVGLNQSPQGVRVHKSSTERKDPGDLSEIPPETILFVPYTPNSELKRAIQKSENEMAKSAFGRVKVVETLGPELNISLSNTALWRNENCGRGVFTMCHKARPMQGQK